ncbi:MAG: signal recognition particle-docking protein FtsY [Muribaculaceae bacterium]|nr:signal recognition particle-docking protein FtsY [Muribaculaceae bacterium]
MALFDIFNRKKAEADHQLQPDVVVTEDATTSNVETAIPAAETASEADVPTSASEPEQPQQPFAAEDVADDDTTKKKGFFRSLFSREKKETLDKGLEKTKQGVFAKLAHAVAGKSTIDDEVLDQLEEVFITSDVGVDTTLKIIERIQKRVARDKYVGTAELNNLLCEEITDMLAENNNAGLDDFVVPAHQKPYVIMVVGVNGVGKTTTIGKLAYQYTQAGNKVVLGAADTYRAAADEQLEIWGQRVGVPVIKHKMGTDPASVAYDTVSSAKAQGADVVIIDTAGRLHNNVSLMRELTKIKDVMRKVLPDAPQEVLLVLDGSTGQNAFEQARQFVAATEVNALAVTKLDGTAKGGVVIGISDQFQIPVKYIGLGEGMNHLQVFRREEFVRSLFGF